LSHVPYKGAAPALNDLLGGHIGVLISAIPNAHSHIVAGTIHGLAVTGAKRSALIPAVPTFSEAGLAGYHVPLRWGLPPPGGGHAAPRPRLANRGAQPRPHAGGGAGPLARRGPRAAARHARGVRRHHRPRADDVVRPGEGRRDQPGMMDQG